MEGETEEIIGLYINGINYSYSVSKLEKNNEKLIIKLYDSTNKSNVYFTYEGNINKLKKDILFIESYENLDEIITCLNDIFNKGNAIVEQIEGKYNLKLKCILSQITKISTIPLIKHNNKNEENNELEDRINKLENDYKDLYNKYEELKIKKEDEIKNIVKETLLDKDLKLSLFEDIEQLFLEKYNLNNIPKVKNQNQNNNTANNIVNKVNEAVKSKKDKINNKINSFKQQLNGNIKYITNIKSNINNNYIILQVEIDEEDLNKDIRLFNQVETYKYYCNFEREDIEVFIDDQIVNIKYKNSEWKGDFKYDEKSKNCELSQKLAYNLSMEYEYYWNFTTTGIHTVKIIFKKKLLQCNYLFANCNNIYKIDCSKFDCSEVIDCSRMFFQAPYQASLLIEINLGKLDFALSHNFSEMFYGCNNLEKLDVSYFNTNNSKSFENMFQGCSKLKEINVSKFKATNCENIDSMFSGCNSLESIDMLNWDMKNINNIKYLFYDCTKLKIIKMNFNNNNPKFFEKMKEWPYLSPFKSAFLGLPKFGSFVWKKGTNCDELLKYVLVDWSLIEE